MNVFVSNIDPKQSAKDLADRHVVKMTLESSQLLSTACNEMGIRFKNQYRSTHKHHPCVLGMINNPVYLTWVAQHGIALCSEYQFRYNKIHKSLDVIINACVALDKYLINPGKNLINTQYTESDVNLFPHAVFDEYRKLDTVKAYRAHLRKKYLHLWAPNQARWTNSIKPTWL